MNLRGGLAFQSVCTRALLLYFPAVARWKGFLSKELTCFLTYHSKLTCMTIRDKLLLMSSSMVLHFSFFVTLAWMIVRLVPSVLKWYFTDPLRLLKVWWCCNIQWGREHCFWWTVARILNFLTVCLLFNKAERAGKNGGKFKIFKTIKMSFH